MLVLSSTAYLLPLCLGLYLLAMVVFTVAATCNDLEPQLKISFPVVLSLHLYSMMCAAVVGALRYKDTKSWEAKLRGFFAEFFVATNECWCRRRGAIVYASLLSVLMAFWTFCVPGSPVFLWPWGIFYLTSLVTRLIRCACAGHARGEHPLCHAFEHCQSPEPRQSSSITVVWPLLPRRLEHVRLCLPTYP